MNELKLSASSKKFQDLLGLIGDYNKLEVDNPIVLLKQNDFVSLCDKNKDDTISNLQAELSRLKESLDVNVTEPVQLELKREEKVEAIDISNLYIGFYNDEHVDLFYKTTVRFLKFDDYNSINIYRSRYTDHLGLQGISFMKESWRPVGERLHYESASETSDVIVTCDMTAAMAINDMRMKMKTNKIIDGFSRSSATQEELDQVLDYGYKYYVLKEKGYSKVK